MLEVLFVFFWGGEGGQQRRQKYLLKLLLNTIKDLPRHISNCVHNNCAKPEKGFSYSRDRNLNIEYILKQQAKSRRSGDEETELGKRLLVRMFRYLN